MLGAEEPYAKVPWFWSDQYDLTLQVAGLFDPELDIHRRETGTQTCIVFQCDAQGHLSAAAGVGNGNDARDVRLFERLIEKGAQIPADLLADGETNLKRLLRAA